MDLVCNSTNTVRPFVRVGHKVACPISFLGGPAIVDVDILIPPVFQTKINKLGRSIKSICLGCSIALSNILNKGLVNYVL
jgi:hypothetical protein